MTCPGGTRSKMVHWDRRPKVIVLEERNRETGSDRRGRIIEDDNDYRPNRRIEEGGGHSGHWM